MFFLIEVVSIVIRHVNTMWCGGLTPPRKFKPYRKGLNFLTIIAVCYCLTVITFCLCCMSLNFPSDLRFSNCCAFSNAFGDVSSSLQLSWIVQIFPIEPIRNIQIISKNWSYDSKSAWIMNWKMYLYYKLEYSLLSSFSNSTEIITCPWTLEVRGIAPIIEQSCV